MIFFPPHTPDIATLVKPVNLALERRECSCTLPHGPALEEKDRSTADSLPVFLPTYTSMKAFNTHYISHHHGSRLRFQDSFYGQTMSVWPAFKRRFFFFLGGENTPLDARSKLLPLTLKTHHTASSMVRQLDFPPSSLLTLQPQSSVGSTHPWCFFGVFHGISCFT